MAGSARVSKKQQELLSFVDGFIKGNGYGPSYREVMRGLGYKSVSTVAIHVDALIAKGYLKKGDQYSKRSIEVVTNGREPSEAERALKWLSAQETAFREAGETEKADAVANVLKIIGR